MKSIVGLCDKYNVIISKTGDTYNIIRSTLTSMMNTIEKHNQEISRIMPILRDNFIHWL